MVEKRDFQVFEWTFYPEPNGPVDVQTPSCAEDCEALLYNMEVTIENAVGHPTATLVLHWAEIGDFHMLIHEWDLPGDVHEVIPIAFPLPITSASTFHLTMPTSSIGLKIHMHILVEKLKDS